jgi:DNA repair exonuclease SbcCD nuclease subunit
MIEELRAAHSSDLHIGRDGGDRGIGGLRRVVDAAADAHAHVLLLAGDIFDHSKLGDELLEAVASILDGAPFRTVILPGNHDPLIAGSPYHRLPAIEHVHVLGLPEASVAFDDLGLEVVGEPHHSYDDKHPLPSPREATHRRRIVMAHGHYVSGPHDLHRAWLIRDEDIAALGADYVALGHWDRRERVGRAPHFAHYSGSPDLARSINIARFSNGSGATVVAFSLEDGRETAT